MDEINKAITDIAYKMQKYKIIPDFKDLPNYITLRKRLKMYDDFIIADYKKLRLLKFFKNRSSIPDLETIKNQTKLNKPEVEKLLQDIF